MIKLFNKKVFWIIILLFSFIGAVVGYYLFNQREETLENAQILYCYDSRVNSNPSIETIYKLKDKDEYLDFIFGKEKYLNFRGTVLREGKEVYVLSYAKDSMLVNIAVVNKNTTMTQSYYEELWIWQGFLVDKLPNK